MKWIMKNLTQLFILFYLVQGFHTYKNLIPDGKAEEYDEQLSQFLREILENFRDQMPEGIPEIGLPPVDPLLVPDVQQDIDEAAAKLTMRMTDINITGISKFEIELLKADLQKGFSNISLRLPALDVRGEVHVDGKIVGIFPVRGDGPFHIRVEQVTIYGYGDLNVTSIDDKINLHMNDLKLSLDFGSLELEFEGLLGGARWTQVLLKIISAMSRPLFHIFQGQAMVKLDEFLLHLINEELDKGTLSDIINQIPLEKS